MSDYAAGSDSYKPRLSLRDLLKKYFRTGRRKDEPSVAPEFSQVDNPDSGTEQQSHAREVSGKAQRAIPNWCEPIDETPRSGRK